MTAGILPAGGLCLLSGALLGGLFLAFKLLRLLIRGGRLCAALFDVLFCLICAVTAFFCALALDKGRLRLFQVFLQGLAAWGVIVALDPLVKGTAARIRRAGRWLRAFLRRRLAAPARRLLGRLGRGMGKALKKLLPERKPGAGKARRGKRGRRGCRGKKADRHNRQVGGRNVENQRHITTSTSQSRK